MTAISANQTKSIAPVLTNRQRFVAAARCQPVDRPPVWLMRQAGRALPEYRKLKETGGVQMDFAVTSRADIQKLAVARVVERLSYVDQALRMLRKELGDQTALLGFSGSPWTLATFMMEGASVPKYSRALQLFREDPKTYFALAEKLTAAVTAYLRMQIAAGIDALQIFDSHGGHLAPAEFPEASGRWMREIIAALGTPGAAPAGIRQPTYRAGTAPGAPPVIVFSLGTHGNWNDLIATGANVIGIDWQTSLAEARQLIPENVGLQGNLSPTLISDATPDVVARETKIILETMRGRPGHIFNLGHGVTPAAKLENIAALVETVKSHK